MIMYIIDIGGVKDNLSEEDLVTAEDIVLHRDLIRGFTLNRAIINRYCEFLRIVVGKYVVVEIFEYEVPANLESKEYENLALSFYKELVEEGMSMYAATCPELINYPVGNNDFIIATDSMLEYSCELSQYEDILYEYAVLTDKAFDYLKPLKDDYILKWFCEFILKGIIDRLYDLFDTETGNYAVDPYGVLKWYIVKLKFIF